MKLLRVTTCLGLTGAVAFARDTTPPVERTRFSGGGPFAGPAATMPLLAEDDAPKEPALRFPWIDETLGPWFDFKSTLNQERGLQVGVAYTYSIKPSSMPRTVQRTRPAAAFCAWPAAGPC